MEETSCGWISQLEVCQLLSTSPQVIYPVGLNRHNKPVTTTLPEPLSSSTSIITSKELYLGINIPSPPVKEPEHKALPIGKDSPNTVPSPSKSPPKFKGSMTPEVDNLLTQAIAEASGCKSKHPPWGRLPLYWSSCLHPRSQRLLFNWLIPHPKQVSKGWGPP